MGRRTVSLKELTARVEAKGYRPEDHFEADNAADCIVYGKKTLRDQDGALGRYKQWMEFMANSPTAQDGQYGSIPELMEGSPPPGLVWLRSFFRFHCSSSTGLLSENNTITLDSLKTFMEWFFAGWKRVTGNLVDEAVRKACYKWAKENLVAERVVTNMHKPKFLFTKTEWTRFNAAFWTFDDTHFVHPRNRAQIPFALAVFCWTGARIGAILPNSPKDVQGGIRYRDIEVVLLRINDAGGWKMVYRLDQRWVKNNKQPESVTFGASTTEHNTLIYDDTQYLIALALADGAFHNIKTADNLWEIQIPVNANELILRWEDSVLDRPILRNATMKDGLTDDPLPRKSFDRVLKWVLGLAGYYGYGQATVHAIRRGLGQQINKRYNEVERSQHITQADTRVYGQSYLANTSSVSGKDAFLEDTANHDHVHFFQSLSKFREPGVPQRLPAEREVNIEQDSRLMQLIAHLHELRAVNAEPQVLKVAASAISTYRRKIKANSLKEYQIQWVRERRDWKVATLGKGDYDVDHATDLLEALCRIQPERGRLAKIMISQAAASADEKRQAVNDLYVLISRDSSVLHRPGEEPVDGVCPVEGCGIQMGCFNSKSQYSTHINNCRRTEQAHTLKRSRSEIRYCHTCFNWVVEEDWESHCADHLKSIASKRCGPIIYLHTLICPGFCPFCLGNKELPTSSRWGSWTKANKLRVHLSQHIEAICWPFTCPHPLCTLNLDNRKSFTFHLKDTHSIELPQWQEDSQTEVRSLDLAGQKRKREDSPVSPSDDLTDNDNARPTRVQKVTSKLSSSPFLECNGVESRGTGIYCSGASDHETETSVPRITLRVQPNKKIKSKVSLRLTQPKPIGPPISYRCRRQSS